MLIKEIRLGKTIMAGVLNIELVLIRMFQEQLDITNYLLIKGTLMRKRRTGY